jgi:hypothetical protein
MSYTDQSYNGLVNPYALRPDVDEEQGGLFTGTGTVNAGQIGTLLSFKTNERVFVARYLVWAENIPAGSSAGVLFFRANGGILYDYDQPFLHTLSTLLGYSLFVKCPAFSLITLEFLNQNSGGNPRTIGVHLSGYFQRSHRNV